MYLQYPSLSHTHTLHSQWPPLQDTCCQAPVASAHPVEDALTFILHLYIRDDRYGSEEDVGDLHN